MAERRLGLHVRDLPGFEDADEADPAFKVACGWLPDMVRDLCSSPTLSRLKNQLRDVFRLTYTLVDECPEGSS